MTFQQAYDYYNDLYAPEVAKLQKELLVFWNKRDEGYTLTDEDKQRWDKIEDRIIEIENIIVDVATKVSKANKRGE